MKGKNGKVHRAPTPEEQQLIDLCEGYVRRNGLAYKTVPMSFGPEPRIGLGLASNGELEPVVARLRVLKRGPIVRAYSPLPATRAEDFGKSEVRVEGRMQSVTVWAWPVDEGRIERYLDSCVEAVSGEHRGLRATSKAMLGNLNIPPLGVVSPKLGLAFAAHQQGIGSILNALASNPVLERIHAFLTSPAWHRINAGLGRFQEYLNAIQPRLLTFTRALEKLPERAKDSLSVMASHGWFLDSELTIVDMFGFKDLMDEGRAEEAEALMVAHFESRLDAIADKLMTSYPNRAHILKAAFDAIRRDEHDLAIPVLLTQVDGLCFDRNVRPYFMRENGVPRAVVDLRKQGATFGGPYESPIEALLPIYMSPTERKAHGASFNRHLVLHGESTDYGNRTNSLRAVSFLHCIATALDWKKRDEEIEGVAIAETQVARINP